MIAPGALIAPSTFSVQSDDEVGQHDTRSSSAQQTSCNKVEREGYMRSQLDNASNDEHGSIIPATIRGTEGNENCCFDHDTACELLVSLLASSTTVPKLIMVAYATWYVVVMSLIPHTTAKPFLDALVIGVLIGLVLNVNAYSSYKANAARTCYGNSIATRSTKDQIAISRTIIMRNPSQNQTSIGSYLRNNCMSVLRLFLIPYMVSSYSAAAGGSEEGTFVSVFPVDGEIWGPALAASVAVPGLLVILRKSWSCLREGEKPTVSEREVRA